MSRKLRVRYVPDISGAHRILGMAVCLLMMCITGTAYGQSATVSGTVTDQVSGEVLPGVNIAVRGTTAGTSTDASGFYELTVSSLNDTLQFSFIGYDSQTVPINGRTTIDVELKPTTISGDELVVIGYGTQQKRDLTGSVAVVNLEALTTQPDGQVTRQLQGLASGVTVISSGQPGEEPQIRIRGFNTFGNNEPLYVVDGVPTQNINDLNPGDIGSMQVLKDAAAASIYGSRASNGVVVITTKKGSGKVSVNYDAYVGVQMPYGSNPWDILSPQEMAELKWMAVRNSGKNPIPDPQYGSGSTPVLPDYIDPAGTSEADIDKSSYYVDPNYTSTSQYNSFTHITPANKRGTDWYDEIFDPAGTMNHDLSVSGGGDIGNYLFSFNYLNQQGTLMETYNKRYSIRANTQFNITDDFRIGENLSYSVTDNPQINALTEGSAIGMALRQQPIIPVYDIMGNFAGTHGAGLGNARNPVAIQYRTRNNRALNNRLFGNVFAELEFLGNFTIRTDFGGEIYSGSSRSFAYPEYENAENNTVNSFTASSYNGHNWTWTNTLRYVENFGNFHDVEVVLGTEAYKNEGEELGGTTQGYFSFDPAFTNLNTGSGIQTNTSNSYGDKLFSFFGRVDYTFDNKYLVSATLRRDGSSRFLNERWGWFPAASVGWRISEESFMDGLDWLTDFKVRAGYGIMGNQLNVDPNNAYSLYVGNPNSSYYAIDGSNSGTTQGLAQQRIGNPDAKWEKNISTNIGFDATLLDGRFDITIDYYRKDIKDLLYNPLLAGTAGNAEPPYINVGNIKNSGIDASVQAFGNIGNELSYSVGATFTTYQNEIVKIADDVEYFDQEGRRFTGSNIIRNAVGQEISSYYGYKIVGFWNEQSEINQANAQAPGGLYQEGAGVGRFRYEDTNGDGRITAADKQFLGSPNPDFSYGLNFGLDYKNFDLNLFFYGVQGNEIWNQVKWWTDFYSSFAGAKSNTALYDSWTPENRNAAVAIQEEESYTSTNGVPNSYFVEDGSYLRLKNIQLGYSLPADILQEVGIRRLRFYVQAANLFTLTGYSGMDPEIGGGNTNFGIDEGSYANQRQFLLGISLSY